MQFLRDQEIKTRGAKQGVIIHADNGNEKEYWFGRLRDETVHIDFEHFWYKVFGLIKEQCYHSMKSEDSIYCSYRRIKIPAGDEKCVEVMITDRLVMPYYNREKNPAVTCVCDKYM